jgi:hypothetical protein
MGVQVTLYPQSMGPDVAGVPLTGKVAGYNAVSEGLFEAEITLNEAQGLPFVQLLAELIGGRPARPAT